MYIRKAILGAATALALAAPAAASDLPVSPYTSGPTYERETHTYEHRTAPGVVVAEPAPVVPAETIIVRRPVVVAPPRVVVEEYPVYAVPRVYAAPPVYAYAGPSWRHGYHRHFHGGW
jgi:hypothetical protein